MKSREIEQHKFGSWESTVENNGITEPIKLLVGLRRCWLIRMINGEVEQVHIEMTDVSKNRLLSMGLKKSYYISYADSEKLVFGEYKSWLGGPDYSWEYIFSRVKGEDQILT